MNNQLMPTKFESKEHLRDYTLNGSGKYQLEASLTGGRTGYLVVQILDRWEVDEYGNQLIKYEEYLFHENGQYIERTWAPAWEVKTLVDFLAMVERKNGKIHPTVGA